jgi:hypothetical protein
MPVMSAPPACAASKPMVSACAAVVPTAAKARLGLFRCAGRVAVAPLARLMEAQPARKLLKAVGKLAVAPLRVFRR